VKGRILRGSGGHRSGARLCSAAVGLIGLADPRLDPRSRSQPRRSRTVCWERSCTAVRTTGAEREIEEAAQPFRRLSARLASWRVNAICDGSRGRFPAANPTARLSIWPVCSMCAPKQHDHDQEAHNALQVARNSRRHSARRNLRNEKVRVSSPLSSTHQPSAD
jgi:hypothetical protein